MTPLKMFAFAASVAAVAHFGAGAADAAPKGGQKSGGSCVTKAAEGTGGTEKAAKFQVDEALLQAVDWGAWASWMSNGTTPGYNYGPRKYSCKGGSGLGFTCRGQATICKL